MYYVELTNQIKLLKYLVIYMKKTDKFLAFYPRFTLIDSNFKKVSLCV